MSALKDFQTRYGAEWAGITNSEAFLAALGMANLEKQLAIRLLTDEQIAKNGPVILADYRGHMNYENALLGLAEKKEFVFQELGAETYPNPEQEAAEAALVEGAGNPESTFTGTVGPSVHEQLFPQPKPQKRRGRPPGSGKRKK